MNCSEKLKTKWKYGFDPVLLICIRSGKYEYQNQVVYINIQIDGLFQ